MPALLLLIALFVVLPVLAVRYGTDSRRTDSSGGWPFSARARTP